MGGDKFKKAAAGQPLEIPAPTWNAMVDAARAHAENQQNQVVNSDALSRQSGIVKVRNQSGQARDRFAILGIDTPAILPSANELQFKNQVILNVIAPAETHRGRFVILLDPLGVGQIGRAWVSGICAVKIQIDEEWHSFAELESGNTQNLISKPSGSAQILWHEPEGARSSWALVRLSNRSKTQFLISVPNEGIPGRVGNQAGAAECQLYQVNPTGLVVPFLDQSGQPVLVTVHNPGGQPIRGPVDGSGVCYLNVHYDQGSWIVERHQQTLLCRPNGWIGPHAWGLATELRYTGAGWVAGANEFSVYNVCEYDLFPEQQIVCHYHEDPDKYLAIAALCCDDSSSSSSSSSGSGVCVRIPGVDLSSLPVVDAEEVDYVLAVRGKCLVAVEIADCEDESEPSAPDPSEPEPSDPDPSDPEPSDPEPSEPEPPPDPPPPNPPPKG